MRRTESARCARALIDAPMPAQHWHCANRLCRRNDGGQGELPAVQQGFTLRRYTKRVAMRQRIRPSALGLLDDSRRLVHCACAARYLGRVVTSTLED
jgi:hypothetical protein